MSGKSVFSGFIGFCLALVVVALLGYMALFVILPLLSMK